MDIIISITTIFFILFLSAGIGVLRPISKKDAEALEIVAAVLRKV